MLFRSTAYCLHAARRLGYLSHERYATLDVAVLVDVTPDELGTLLERGWRRFGPVYFRPGCQPCTSCDSLRIPVAGFSASTSQRRARRNAAGLLRTVQAPVVDDERLALYHRWHAQRESHRGWDSSPMDAERYHFEFSFPHPCVREVTFRDPAHGHRLVGLGIVDEVPDALSAVYFYWDPELAPSSLGVAHVVGLVDDAAKLGKAHVYLGYRVEGCVSLAYKNRYRPYEMLEGRPSASQMPLWRPHAEED